MTETITWRKPEETPEKSGWKLVWLELDRKTNNGIVREQRVQSVLYAAKTGTWYLPKFLNDSNPDTIAWADVQGPKQSQTQGTTSLPRRSAAPQPKPAAIPTGETAPPQDDDVPF